MGRKSGYRALLTVLERTATGDYRLSWRGETADDWDYALDQIKALPVHARNYLPAEKKWWVAAEALPYLREVFVNFDLMLSYNRMPVQSRVPEDVADAFERLHLTPEAPPELIKAAQRILAKQHHPDIGGDHRSMVAINAAAETALDWAS